MKIQVFDTIEELKRHFGLTRDGVLLEPDLDVVDTDCDINSRKRRDAEVLCTLAANAISDVLELGTSHGRGAFKLATNIAHGVTCHTVNILPEQHDASGGKMVTHLIPKEEIGSYYRERGVSNVAQYFANTARWTMPDPIRDLWMVFVDAAHDEQNVYLDSKLVWDRVAPGGFLVWHDFCPFLRQRHDWIDASMRGAERFLRERRLEELEVVNLRHSWCGVLRKPPQEARPLLAGQTNCAAPRTEPLARTVSVSRGSSVDLHRLRYAIVFPAYSVDRITEESRLASYLSGLGYDVEAIGIPCHGGWWPFPILDKKWRARSADLMSRYGDLEVKLRRKDVLIAAGGSMLHPEFIRQLSTFNVFWCADDPESSSTLSEPVAAAFDFACVANIACVGDYARWGVRNAAWLPIPLSAQAVDGSISEENILTGRRELDVVMCCERVYGLSDRAQRLERLQREFPRATLRGKGWPDGFVTDAELRGLYRRARLGWNLHNSVGPVNGRLMMLPAFGVMQICDCRDNLGKIFELGTEVIGFDTMNECVDATRYYLAHDEERRRVALRGWRRVMSDYTEERWWARLLSHIQPHLNGRHPAVTPLSPLELRGFASATPPQLPLACATH